MNDKFPWMTAVMVSLAVVVVIIGGVVVILGNLTFETYLNDIEAFAAAVGLLGVGRGIQSGLVNHGTKSRKSHD